MPGNSVEWWFSPYSPSRNADALDDTDPSLSHEYKKEDHKVEGTVAPVGKKDTDETSRQHLAVHAKPTDFSFGWWSVCVCVCLTSADEPELTDHLIPVYLKAL